MSRAKLGGFYNPWAKDGGKKDRVVQVPVKKLEAMRGLYGLDKGKRLSEEWDPCKKFIKDAEEETVRKHGEMYWWLNKKKLKTEAFAECVDMSRRKLEAEGYVTLPAKIREARGLYLTAWLPYRRRPQKLREEVGNVMNPTHAYTYSEEDKEVKAVDASSRDRRKYADEYVDKLAEAIRRGKGEVPMVAVRKDEMERGVFGEGRHRILAAKRAGLKKMPILLYER